MRTDRSAPLHDGDRARLLRAANDRPLGERLLAHLVLDDGLTLAQAVRVRCRDFSESSVTVEIKTGERETRPLSSQTITLARGAANGAVPDATVVTGRTGRPLSTVAARDILLGLARTSGVSVRSVHQLRADRRAVVAG